MLAQRYPDAYNGIAASAPAINWPSFFVEMAWAPVLISLKEHFPPPCEFNAFTDAYIKHCDPLNSVVDGLVSDPENCNFDPFSMVNRTISYLDTDNDRIIHRDIAELVQAIWDGPKGLEGRLFWFGPGP